MFLFTLFVSLTVVYAGPSTESFKDQYCTDPRTMKKHAAYTEWADAYSCSRHRCQPGGRNLAIYTVGCKRVEAPESAIECEEVVEDTNMQFPYCCTRLRCLVVVRGEVWTRVLGQPWETLPAAPWSHMYKMKKPPPSDGTFLPKNDEGPVYELATETDNDGPHDKVLRATKKSTTENPDCKDPVPRAAPTPDIVIALSTNNDLKEHKKSENIRHKRVRKTSSNASPYFDEDAGEPHEPDVEDAPVPTEKPIEHEQPASEERFYANAYGVTQKVPFKSHHQVSWTEIPQNQWNEHDPSAETNAASRDTNYHQPELQPEVEKKEEKPSNLQALVDAIGTRMRDIENVVQRMSDKVHQTKTPEPEYGSLEKAASDTEAQLHKHHKLEVKEHTVAKTKRPGIDAEHYKRFSVRNRGSKYLHTTDSTTDQPLYADDINGYFSDASNSVLRRANPPKEPPPTYMAPVDNRRKAPHIQMTSDSSDEVEKKHKKHVHKKKRGKGRGHKKHHSKDDKRKRYRTNSVEVDKNVVSLEDSSAVASK